VDGNDLLAVYEAARRAVEECRTGLGPVLLELLTYRLTGHSRRDPCHYQPKEERSAWSANDPIVRYTRKLLADSEIVQSDLDKIREEIFHEIDSAVEQAKSAPTPLLDDLLTDVYA
jgi:pyruvate dehydrogenase E1 component alpha subunit